MSSVSFVIPENAPRYVRAAWTTAGTTIRTTIQGQFERDVPYVVTEPHRWLGWLGVKVSRRKTRTETYWADISPAVVAT